MDLMKLYDEILQRERTAATPFLASLWHDRENLMVNQARAILLQWGRQQCAGPVIHIRKN